MDRHHTLWPDRRLRTQITMPLDHLSHLIERVERMLDLSRSVQCSELGFAERICRTVEPKTVSTEEYFKNPKTDHHRRGLIWIYGLCPAERIWKRENLEERENYRKNAAFKRSNSFRFQAHSLTDCSLSIFDFSFVLRSLRPPTHGALAKRSRGSPSCILAFFSYQNSPNKLVRFSYWAPSSANAR